MNKKESLSLKDVCTNLYIEIFSIIKLYRKGTHFRVIVERLNSKSISISVRQVNENIRI